MHTPNKPNPRKTNRTQKEPNTAHCRQSVKQTAQRAEKVVEHTVPDKNRSGALNAMRSTQRETIKSSVQRARKRKRYGREVERATRNATKTGQARNRASSARRNGNGTDGNSSEKRARQQHGRWGKKGENEVGNLSHTLGRRKEATARQSSIVHYGA